MIRFNITEIVKLRKRLYEIDKLDIADIEWHRDGVLLAQPSDEEIEEWKFTGLGTTFFATMTFFTEAELKAIGMDHRPGGLGLILSEKEVPA